MREIISVVSGKGGAGKSTACINIAAALCLLGRRVMLIDLKIGYRSLDLMLGVEPAYDFRDVALGMCGIDKAAVYAYTAGNGCVSLLNGVTDDYDLSPDCIRRIVDSLHNYDYILLDCAAGGGEWTRCSLEASDAAYIVSTDSSVSVRNADTLLSELESIDCEILCLLSMVNINIRNFKEKITQAANIISAPVLGIIPFDYNIVLHSEAGFPLIAAQHKGVRSKGAYAAYYNIARRMTGEKIPLLHKVKVRDGYNS